MSFILENLQFNTVAVNNEVNKITINTKLPNAAYDLKIRLITFQDKQAEILTEVIQPSDSEIPTLQVITEKELITFIDSKYNTTVKVLEGF
ncbi:MULTISPECIES: hypothetical protein [Bacillus]|uniref:Uncharacterized protein n=1 Tax=Bacillus cereus TaxID=1396 RepID=A0AAN5XK53_BACCE|nr:MULTISPECIES: hypothetical protein [Bacillus]AXR17076.1 hypothetical protein DOS87_13610 [Bacillus sp. CR71]AXR22770.1 hypothetical protein DPQ26_13375 [Bacillus sp. E25]KAB2446031.1 hypothetical protein F8165_28260 [Bacillus cereus]KAB2486771.1 hypothetical protein F8157_09450 [Bacillus cereus]OJE33639.1 hypothetical protein A9490_20480 [Bacillus thuringiensis]